MKRKEKRKKDAHPSACRGKTKQGVFRRSFFPFVFLGRQYRYLRIFPPLSSLMVLLYR
jgi:hypothetical protein